MKTRETNNGDSIAFGELNENGVFVQRWEIPVGWVNTEQRVLAWVYHLCDKAGFDQNDIKEFIDCCKSVHQELDIYDKGV